MLACSPLAKRMLRKLGWNKEVHKMSRNLSEDLHNPYLFSEYKAGEYEYEVSADGKSATGSLKIAEDPERDSKAQASAGGEFRRGKNHEWGADDGGHLIGARFGGETGEENLTAQNRNLNRSDYKQMENDWAARLEDGEKVFVHIETDGVERPNAYMGYAIYESPDGTRDFDTFHMVNESRSEVASWEEEAAEWEESEEYDQFEEPIEAEETAELEEPEKSEECEQSDEPLNSVENDYAQSDAEISTEQETSYQEENGYLGDAATENASSESSYESESSMETTSSMGDD